MLKYLSFHNSSFALRYFLKCRWQGHIVTHPFVWGCDPTKDFIKKKIITKKFLQKAGFWHSSIPEGKEKANSPKLDRYIYGLPIIHMAIVYVCKTINGHFVAMTGGQKPIAY